MPAMAQDPSNTAWRIGVDTGGTFSDLLLVDPAGAVRACCKVLSTPDDPGRAVRQGIDTLLDAYEQQSGGRPEVGQVIHGSTVATNALLEAKGDAAALITTAGFEDLLTLARQDRPELYALTPRRHTPPIPRHQTIGVAERIGYDGQVITALTQHEIDRVVEALQELKVDAVTVCLLHSYANEAHEQALAEAIGAAMPSVHLTVSSALLPELREYERASTCAVNAVVGPTMSRYIGALDEALGNNRLRIMASGGGTLPPDAVTERPVETVMSGPAGGVIGAWAMAQQASEPRIIGFDMGGTSTDVALCDQGPTRTTESAINALPIKLPMIDIHTVGAGGGSVAWIDGGGALRVGPRSAGADPGPACYGNQGENPCIATVTDAHAVLGHLREGRRLGEALSVNTNAARSAVGTLAEPLGLSIEATAEGILRVADAAMARAIQRVSVQRGHDARAYTLVAFGGAGGLHACRLADLLGMTRVLVPVHGGLLSAYGMLAAPPRCAFSHAVLRSYMCDGGRYADPMADDAVVSAIGVLAGRADRALDADHVSAEGRTLNRALDLRFAGQSYEITVPIEAERPVIDRFLDEHRRLYGYAPEGKPIELVTARLEALGPTPVVSPGEIKPSDGQPDLPAGHHWRDTLGSGERFTGPALIEEYAATTVVAAGWSVGVLVDGQLLLQREGTEGSIDG